MNRHIHYVVHQIAIVLHEGREFQQQLDHALLGPVDHRVQLP